MKNQLYPEIIKLIQVGDVNAFQELYCRLKNKVMSFSIKLLGNSEEAEEMTQDIFVRLWENRAKLDPEKNIEAFLFVMVRSSFLDALKKKKQQASYIDAQEYQAATNRLTDEYIDYTECCELLDYAIQRLPKQAKLVYRMSRVDGLSHKEISKNLEISPFTVSNHLKYALKHLKKYLKKMSPEILTIFLMFPATVF